MANSDPGNPRKSNQCHWLHDWGKWEFIDMAFITSRENLEKHVGIVNRQSRKCDRCGYIQTKLDVVMA